MEHSFKTFSVAFILGAGLWLLVTSQAGAVPLSQTGAMQSICLVLIAMWLWMVGNNRDRDA